MDEATIQQAKVIACAALHAIIVENSAFGVGVQGETGVITSGKAVREGNTSIYTTYMICIYMHIFPIYFKLKKYVITQFFIILFSRYKAMCGVRSICPNHGPFPPLP